MKFKVTVQYMWFAADGTETTKEQTFRVTAPDIETAEEKAEEKAIYDDHFNLGCPHMVQAMNVTELYKKKPIGT